MIINVITLVIVTAVVIIIVIVNTQGLHSQILMTGEGGGGGPTEVHILYPKKSQLQNLSTQENHYFF